MPLYRPGFTLSEILIVMLITSILALGVHASFQQAHFIWRRAELPRPHYQATRTLVETLRSELTYLYWPALESKEDSPIEMPFQLTTLADSLTLSLYTLVPSWKTGLLGARPSKITYQYHPANGDQNGRLVRHEVTCSGETIISQAQTDTMMNQLTELHMWVAEQNNQEDTPAWQKNFEGKDTPPTGLKLQLVWQQPGLKPTQFETHLLIPCQGGKHE